MQDSNIQGGWVDGWARIRRGLNTTGDSDLETGRGRFCFSHPSSRGPGSLSRLADQVTRPPIPGADQAQRAAPRAGSESCGSLSLLPGPLEGAQVAVPLGPCCLVDA